MPLESRHYRQIEEYMHITLVLEYIWIFYQIKVAKTDYARENNVYLNFQQKRFMTR